MSTKSQFPVLLGVEITEGENACEICADITGFHADNVSVTALENTLIIEMTSQHEPGQSYYLGELDSESYRRVIPLGFDVEDQAIMTHFNNGKLDILVHKQARANTSTAVSTAA